MAGVGWQSGPAHPTKAMAVRHRSRQVSLPGASECPYGRGVVHVIEAALRQCRLGILALHPSGGSVDMRQFVNEGRREQANRVLLLEHVRRNRDILLVR